MKVQASVLKNGIVGKRLKENPASPIYVFFRIAFSKKLLQLCAEIKRV